MSDLLEIERMDPKNDGLLEASPFQLEQVYTRFLVSIYFVPTNHLCTTCDSVIDQSILGWVAKAAFLTLFDGMIGVNI